MARKKKKTTKNVNVTSETVLKDEVKLQQEVTEQEVKEIKETKKERTMKEEKKKPEKTSIKFRDKRVVIHNLHTTGISTINMIATDTLNVRSNSIYEFRLDRKVNSAKLVPPYDIYFELVSVFDDIVKLKPRVNKDVKDGEIVLIVE